MKNKIISDLKKQRNKIYSQMRKIDEKIRKEETKEDEEEKVKYVGRCFKHEDYSDNPRFVKVIKYIKSKGYEILSIDVDNKDFWLSRYVTYYLPEELVRCSKELFQKKLNKGLKKFK